MTATWLIKKRSGKLVENTKLGGVKNQPFGVLTAAVRCPYI